MRRSRQLAASAIVSLSLFASSTAAVAQTAPAPVAQFDRWTVLSVMSSGAPAAAVCGAAAATAAQPAGGCVLPQIGVAPVVPEQAQPLPPPPPPQYAGVGMPPLPVLLVWAGVLAAMIYIATRSNHTHVVPNSPV